MSEQLDEPNYSICVLCLVFNDYVPTRVCLYAGKNFTDHIRLRWSPSSRDIKPILDTEKCEIVDLILAQISKAPWRVESRLPEALTIIGFEMDPPQTPILESGSADEMTVSEIDCAHGAI